MRRLGSGGILRMGCRFVVFYCPSGVLLAYLNYWDSVNTVYRRVQLQELFLVRKVRGGGRVWRRCFI